VKHNNEIAHQLNLDVYLAASYILALLLGWEIRNKKLTFYIK